MNIPIQNTLLPLADRVQGSATAPAGTSPAGNPPLAIGEVIPVRVVQGAGASGYVLAMKGAQILAHSDLPLSQGEKLLVRIEQLTPQMVLRIQEAEVTSAPLLRGYALDYSANPQALRDMILTGQALLDDASLLEMLPDGTKEQVRQMLKILDSSVFSAKSLQNPLFLKDYVANLGLLLERHLGNLVQERTQPRTAAAEAGLKGLLLRLSEDLRTLPQEGDDPGGEKSQKISRLSRYVEASIKTIENQQMVNVSQRGDTDSYLLQIPILCSDGIRTGELIIETEKQAGDDRAGRKYQVILFLDMDALGEVMVEASLAVKTVTCLFRFTDDDARQFFAPLMDELKGSITQIGYECGTFRCLTVKTVTEMKEEYHRALFHDRCEINVLA